MRKISPLLILAWVAACALPETRWEKPGNGEKTTTDDLSACRRAAYEEAVSASPYGFSSPLYGSAFYGIQNWGGFENNRVYAELRLTDFCMRNKGYTQVTVPPRTAPATTK